MSTEQFKAVKPAVAPAQVVAVVEEAGAVEAVAVEPATVAPVAVAAAPRAEVERVVVEPARAVVSKPVVVAGEPVVVTNETVVRANQAVGNLPAAPVEVVRTGEALVKAEPAKPGEFFGKHKKEHQRGHKSELAVVATEQALLEDVARYRGQLVQTIDELHTRLSPKYQIDQLKSTWSQAGTDALAILKNEGSPVDETRKKKAESILKAGGAISGLFALKGLHKLLKTAKARRTVRKAISKGMPQEHVELLGVVEGIDVDNGEDFRFEDATVEGLDDFEPLDIEFTED